MDRTPREGRKPVVGVRSLGCAANRVRRCLNRPDGLIGSRTCGPVRGFPVALIGTLGILLAAVVFSLSANIYETLTTSFDELWSASFLLIPATLILAAILPLSVGDWDRAFRGASAIQERVTAIYMFYRTGEPLVALASSRNLPIGAEQLEGLLAVVGNFVETS